MSDDARPGGPMDRAHDQRVDDARQVERTVLRRPGWLAYTGLAVMTALALMTSLMSNHNATRQSDRAAVANCRVQAATRSGLVDLLNRLTAPRTLGTGATADQLDHQEAQNREGAQYRSEAIGKLRALACGDVNDGTPVAIAVAVPPPPPAGPKGVSGEQGPSGLTGPSGPAGTPGLDGGHGENGAPGAVGAGGADGVAGVAGVDGAPGAPGAPGADGAPGATGPEGPVGPVGPAGPQGPPGEPAPTTTTTVVP